MCVHQCRKNTRIGKRELLDSQTQSSGAYELKDGFYPVVWLNDEPVGSGGVMVVHAYLIREIEDSLLICETKMIGGSLLHREDTGFRRLQQFYGRDSANARWRGSLFSQTKQMAICAKINFVP